MNETFESGDIIEFCGDKFIVIENYGRHGKVKEYESTTVIDNFHWDFQGIEWCKLVKKGNIK